MFFQTSARALVPGSVALVLFGCGDASAPRGSTQVNAGGTAASAAGASPSGGSQTAGGGASKAGGGGLAAEGGSPTAVAGTSTGGATAGAAAGGALMSGAPSLGGESTGTTVGGTGGGADDRLVLFDGGDLSRWRARDGGAAAPWSVSGDAFAVVPGSGDLQTRASFGDIQLHVEFQLPMTPAANGEQDRGNSGIYLMGRYEVQVLDSYMHPLQGMNDCGAIYELKDADTNAALPAGSWQTYEITFRAPRYVGQQKTANARVSVIWNGRLVQDDVEVPAPTRLGDAEGVGDAPLRLQDHGHGVRFRNVWLQKL